MAATDERKPVTVLFADLKGSTELATQQDPEHLRALLSAFFDEMRQQIEAFGGTVEKFAGDAVMAVFGVPRVNEDDAERAVRAAFAMQESLAQLNPMFEQEYGARLVLRIGIATGDAVAASRAVNDFMVTGEVPNLAGRLQAVGEGITVSETTHRLLAPHLEAERLEPLSLKGFSQPGHRIPSPGASRDRAPPHRRDRPFFARRRPGPGAGRPLGMPGGPAAWPRPGGLYRGRGRDREVSSEDRAARAPPRGPPLARGTLPVLYAEHELCADHPDPPGRARTRARRGAGHRPDQTPSSGSDAQRV